MRTFIIAADRMMDGRGDHAETEKIIKKAEKAGLRISELRIVSLAKRWADKLQSGEFKSGASAMGAINRARKLLREHKADVVVIKGEDFLCSGYSKEDRAKYMKLYSHRFTPLEGYNKLVPVFLKDNGLSDKQYLPIRDALFENYSRTWKQLHPESLPPDERWFHPLTKYFRGVDCANPNIDYSAQIILTDQEHADVLKIAPKHRIAILGNAFTKLNVDGYESIPKIAPYLHMKRTIDKAVKEAGIDFNDEYLKGRALIDAYTCYPIVPMALLLQMGLVKELTVIPKFLEQHEVTITGGLNLAKAPWNLTSLNSIIALREKIIGSSQFKYGLAHGNGSLGNQQGITILGKG